MDVVVAVDLAEVVEVGQKAEAAVDVVCSLLVKEVAKLTLWSHSHCILSKSLSRT